MKFFLFAAVALAVVAQGQVLPAAFVVPDPISVGLFDNPATSTTPVPAIPSAPDCTVRPQTIVEIKRMRQSAARIASMIQTEVAIMEKRKTYVEQMTSYLNDRIRELNKVKSELEEENRWIEVSNQRIAELAQKEKLVKMQDVLACLNANKKREGDQAASQGKIIQGIAAQSHAIESEIKKIQTSIANVQQGKAAEPAAPGAPAPAGEPAESN